VTDSTFLPVTLPTIAVLGAGSMGRAILAGLLQPHVLVHGGIRVTNRSVEKSAEFETEPRVTAWATTSNPEANRAAVAGASIVVVAVKPAMVPDLLDEISPALAAGTLVVSVAAGVSTATMEAHLPAEVVVLRSMPNTPAAVGLGVTGLCAGSRASREHVELVTSMFATVGDVVFVQEEQIDALGSLSGSGPAYVFYLVEQFTKVALGYGFTPEQAHTLVQGTFLGSVALLEETGEDPAELRRRVTSPNGTTERAIAVFDEVDLHAVFERATSAAIARSQELAAGR
jgi:pyrroline-5-carboxylate reductase